MSSDRDACWGTDYSGPGLLSAFHMGLIGRVLKVSAAKNTWVRFRMGLRRLLPTRFRKNANSIHPWFDEAVFRFILDHEVKRSEQSNRPFNVLLLYFASPEGKAIRMDGKVLVSLLPAIPTVVRETDYIGWYRDEHILGVVLTAVADFSTEAMAGRIEERLVRQLRGSLSMGEVSRLRLRFVQSHELGILESMDRVAMLE